MLRVLVPAVLLAAMGRLPIETLTSIAALPPHLAGRLEEMTACEQARDGRYFIFDRRSHAVFAVPPSRDDIKKIIEIGAEPGRVLRPTGFDLADDETFVVADAPGSVGRVQVFHLTGASLGGFTLGHEVPLVAVDRLVISGIGSLEYTGRSVLMSRPENGALITEYELKGAIIRTFGLLRPTGQEDDRPVHLALNSGLVVINPAGGFYFVFLAGTPVFRKYDAAGTLLFERHIEGVEMDEYVRSIPTRWPRRQSADGAELPVVRSGIRAAAADREGNLWISLATPHTYVYDSQGDKRRTVQFRGAGIISPTALSFTQKGHLLVAPGCYTFDP